MLVLAVMAQGREWAFMVTEWQARYNLSFEELRRLDWVFGMGGWWPVDVNGCNEVNRLESFSAVWESSLGPETQMHYGVIAADHERLIATLLGRGLRPITISGHETKRNFYFNSVWQSGLHLSSFRVRQELTQNHWEWQKATLPDEGFRPVDVCGYMQGGQVRFASIWVRPVPWKLPQVPLGRPLGPLKPRYPKPKPGPRPLKPKPRSRKRARVPLKREPRSLLKWTLNPFTKPWFPSVLFPEWVSRHGMTEPEFRQHYLYWLDRGYVLRRLSGYLNVDGTTRYVTLWDRKPAPKWWAGHGLTIERLGERAKELKALGYRPVKVNGYPEDGTIHYASIWHKADLSNQEYTAIENLVQAFREAHKVPGVSIAMTRNGKLIFARGYGDADDPSTPDALRRRLHTGHLFRIASLSKPITAMAVFRAIEAGKLGLDHLVFGEGGILGIDFGPLPDPDSPIAQITVRHLLEHTSGWTNEPDDPMFQNPADTHAQLITRMLARPLTNAPESRFLYLNFGYCVLGRVLEKVSGLSYPDYVREQVLRPCGVSDMHIAKDTRAQRRSNEVTYSGQGGANPYMLPVARMDAHGGWIANPTDLLKILLRFDSFASKRDLLQPSTITMMTTAQTAPPVIADQPNNYAKGWWVHPDGNWFHTGSLPGSACELVRTQDGFCWAILTNTRDDRSATQRDLMFKALDTLGWKIKEAITDWPPGEEI